MVRKRAKVYKDPVYSDINKSRITQRGHILKFLIDYPDTIFTQTELGHYINSFYDKHINHNNVANILSCLKYENNWICEWLNWGPKKGMGYSYLTPDMISEDRREWIINRIDPSKKDNTAFATHCLFCRCQFIPGVKNKRYKGNRGRYRLDEETFNLRICDPCELASKARSDAILKAKVYL